MEIHNLDCDQLSLTHWPWSSRFIVQGRQGHVLIRACPNHVFSVAVQAGDQDITSPLRWHLRLVSTLQFFPEQFRKMLKSTLLRRLLEVGAAIVLRRSAVP